MARRKPVLIAIADQVESFLLENPGATRDQIARGIGIGKYDKSARVYNALRKMADAGKLDTRWGHAGMSGPLHYYLRSEYEGHLRMGIGTMPPLDTITNAKRNAKPPKVKRKKKRPNT